MSQESVVVPGVIRNDGTLEVSAKVGLAPGPVEVTVRAKVSTPGAGGDWWDALQRLQAIHKASGAGARSAEEIDADINVGRDEWEEHQLALESLQGRRGKAGQESNPSSENPG
jgi:hypothetical protein